MSRSRKGSAGSASGPSTPAPDQAPESISSSATTGLTAVCQTTAWEPYSAIDQALSTTWYRYTSRGAPSVPVPVTQVPAQVSPRIRRPARPDRAGRRRPRRAARPSRHLPAPGWCESRPSLCRVCRTPMNSPPRPYLNVTRLGVHPARHEQHLLVLHVDALDRADPGREGEDLRLAERLGGVPAPVPLPDDRRVEALLDRGPDGEGGREVVALHHEVRAVPHADLVDLAEQRVGGVAREDIGQAGLDAHADQRQLAAGLPFGCGGELLVAQLDAASCGRARRDRACDSDIAMSR